MGDLPDSLLTTRAGVPLLWGQGEVAAFGDLAAGRDPVRYVVGSDGHRVPPGRVKVWVGLPGFPGPLARLRMGPVFLAEEVMPWVVSHLARPQLRRPIEATTVTAIESARDLRPATVVAEEHGVSVASVYRIWMRR